MDDYMYKLYNVDVSDVYYENVVSYVFFACHFIERIPFIFCIIKHTFIYVNQQWEIKIIRIERKNTLITCLFSHVCPCDLY